MVGSKRGSNLAEILELLFQRYLPSKPTARMDALTLLETPLKVAKSVLVALRLLRAAGPCMEGSVGNDNSHIER
eukprot:5007843-Amphidinium_carterae.6